MSKLLPLDLYIRQALLYPLDSPFLPPEDKVLEGYSYAADRKTGVLICPLWLDTFEYHTDDAVQLAYASDAGLEISWTERRPAGDVDLNWSTVASDSDGSHLIAGAEGGRLWTSADYGVNWTERKPAGDVVQNWRGVASDSDGSHLAAVAAGGRLWTSADYGVNWTERKPAGDVNQDWVTVASDSDGSHLIAGVYGGRLWTSIEALNLQCYCELAIVQQGTCSLKGVATVDSLNNTLTRKVSPTIDLSGKDTWTFYIRSNRTGSNIKVGIHDSGGVTTEVTPNITSPGTWQKVKVDISGVADADKDVIDEIKITIVDAAAPNVFYTDSMKGL